MSVPIVNLKKIREKQLLTQTDLAKKAGVAIGVITRAESGVKISLGSIKRLAKCLGIRPEKLMEV